MKDNKSQVGRPVRVFATIIIGFSLLLSLVPNQFFIALGCDTTCISQLYIWTFSLMAIGLGTGYFTENIDRSRILSGLFIGTFALQVILFIAWSVNVYQSGIRLL